ncbi:MAG TPA: S16 family serine protease [Acidimicrobiales bacterium]|nr:S16 family serine protease [Acidimicrobiales bacterium]
MVVRSPLGWDPVVPSRKRPWLPYAVVGVVLVVALLVSTRIGLPYYALAPGSARDVGELIVAKGAPTYPPEGEVLLTTIELSQVTLLGAIEGWLRDDVDVVPEETIRPPDVSDEDYRRFNVQEMGDSKQTAIVVALRRLGYQVTERGEGALIERVLPQFPANGRLEIGEVIKAVDGKAVSLVQEATAAIGEHRAGEVVRLDVAPPDGSPVRTVEVPLAADPEQGGRPVLGVFLRTSNRAFDLPVDIDIRSGSIGGPSAGLAFTLGVIDALTEGELTGGRKVAVTGTIEIDGRVGDVGGVAQKTEAVKAAGADVFLVPAGEYDDAERRAGDDLRVVKVTTLQEALDALSNLGGDPPVLAAPARSGPG